VFPNSNLTEDDWVKRRRSRPVEAGAESAGTNGT
jgi:hypothetical protein